MLSKSSIPQQPDPSAPQAGFSLIEMMMVLAIMTIIMGSVFKSIDLTQRTSRS
ncbi:MAG: hypothetical protein DMG94_04905, partial [Acidobacteria bacterium]